MDENHPLANYVEPLSIWWSEEGSGVNRSQQLASTKTEKSHFISSEFFDPGYYDFAVSGNIVAPGQPAFPIALHSENSEGADIYLQKDHFQIPMASSRRIELKRTKGKLLMQFSNVPANSTKFEITVRDVYSTVDENFTYGGSASVTKSFTLADPDSYYGMSLAPTSTLDVSGLELKFMDDQNATVALFQDLPIVILRNHITLLRIEEQEILVFVDNQWKVIHDMTVGNPG